MSGQQDQIRVLSSLLPSELAAAADIPIECARRLFSRIQRDGFLPDRAPATIRRTSLDRVKELGVTRALDLVSEARSKVDPFVKYAFAGRDGQAFETVRIPLEKAGRFSVCVSSQVGCAIACKFCATGTMGLSRNLDVWEIVGQVQAVSHRLGSANGEPDGRVHGVVFQGMGEPMSNVARVMSTIRILSEPAGLAIDQRNITVCTSGLIPGIEALASGIPNVRLGISIGDARADRRASIMPIDERYPLSDVLAAVGAHVKSSGYAPMWAYTLLAGVNDDDDAAAALASRALDFAARFGKRPRISLIPFNEFEAGAGSPFTRSADATLDAFRSSLLSRGVGSIVRYSGGGDIAAACGQLIQLKERPAGLAKAEQVGF